MSNSPTGGPAAPERRNGLLLWILNAWLLARRVRRGDPPGFCRACGCNVVGFLPYRRGESSRSPVMRELRVIGSDVERHACPKCGAHDRERHLLLYFDSLGDRLACRGLRVLHFAPEPAIARHVLAQGPAAYVQADLHPDRPGVDRVDLCRMPYRDGSFDLVIANHVLEHVADDADAIREVRRVLRPGGLAVLQTPFSPVLRNTLEDPQLQPAEARQLLFGQHDHVRVYGSDLPCRIERQGMASRIRAHEELLPDVEPRRYGVNAREPLLLFERTD